MVLEEGVAVEGDDAVVLDVDDRQALALLERPELREDGVVERVGGDCH